MKKSIGILLFAAFLNVQCNSVKNIPATPLTPAQTTANKGFSKQYGMFVASKTVDCYGVEKRKCLLTKPSWGTKWDLFYANIEGFNYEPGYEYHLEVKETEIKNPPADSSSLKYTLIKVISKEKKDSDARMEFEKPTFESTWDIVTLNGTETKGYILFKKDGTLSANAGCNTMAGIKFKADTAKNTIAFDADKAASTLMACMNDRDQEFKNALSKVTRYEVVSENEMLLKINDTVLLKLKR